MEAELNIVYERGGLTEMICQFLLNTGSTIEEGRLAKGGSKLTEEYTQECAVCEINLHDYLRLGSPEKVLVSTKDAKYRVAVYAYPGDSVEPGHIFMPRAIWSNVVVDSETFSTGSPLYKGSPVHVEATEEEVLSAEEIVLKVYMRGRR
ncbi:molybdopterin dinucleotide binding domain-containing protein [Methanotrichaceae archaeon M04Ac]|uniref:Molybdopterin dinucleotide binding domain-containing protein n=2 Tax=Candidatus Methanocrinis alkalitolerans TaxID=3033395 RepID=A0ABT5XG06_9EURY|nr:molybdopterin dinucleotide binding domain-containing protein [Candidatus Methanocrinis alkalitolerans]MCR3883145.1 formylmethanofuran dehydrogenase [Methanothrix sp.]MDF0593639.1 molybdopterin dinucleotide binding domain-containing protein [Candidatus Methanocrinis alkalitolerans]